MSQDQEENRLEPVTEKNYPRLKEELKLKLKKKIIIGLILLLLCISVIWLDCWLACSPYDSEDAGSAVLLISIVSVFLAWILHHFGNEIHAIVQEQKTIEHQYLALLSDEKRSEVQKKTRKHRTNLICTVSVIAACIIAVIVVDRSFFVAKKYDNAVSLYEHGLYHEACDAFEGIEKKHYKDTSAYIHLCRSHLDLNRGDIIGAYVDIFYYQKPSWFRHLSPEQEEKINDYIETIAEKREQEHQREMETRDRKIEHSKIPYEPKESSNTKKKEDYDFYDVNGYSNEEDFYYDHYDDFFDFEEAEDYFNEHHK